jgi:hypothetical protein
VKEAFTKMVQEVNKIRPDDPSGGQIIAITGGNKSQQKPKRGGFCNI